jgi:hypothetical protein
MLAIGLQAARCANGKQALVPAVLTQRFFARPADFDCAEESPRGVLRSLPRIKLFLSFSCHDSISVTMGVAGPGWWGCGDQKILLSSGVRRSLSRGVCVPRSGGSDVGRLAGQGEVVRVFPAGRSILSGFGAASDRIPVARRGGQSGRAWYCCRRHRAWGSRRCGVRIRGGACGPRRGIGRGYRPGGRQRHRRRQCGRCRRLVAGALRHRLRAVHGRQGQSDRRTAARPRPGLSAACLRLLRSVVVAERHRERGRAAYKII